MNKLVHAQQKIARLIEQLRASGLQFDAHIVEADPGYAADLPAVTPEIFVDLSGEDSSLLLGNDAELLRALHFYTASVLRLELEELDRLWFDVCHVNAKKRVRFQQLAEIAVARVRETAVPYSFAPMMGCERHMLHRAVEAYGLRAASVGLGGDRCVILYPEGDLVPATVELAAFAS